MQHGLAGLSNRYTLYRPLFWKPIMQKDIFFQTILIPAGQAVELIRLLSSSSYYRSASDGVSAQALSHLLWEPLNLCAAYVLSPTTTSLAEVESPARKLHQLILHTLDLGNTKTASEVLVRLFRGSVAYGGNQSSTKTRFASNVKTLVRELPLVLKELYGAIGYMPEVRTQWLAKLEKNAPAVIARGRISGWKTFVRNKSWVPLAAQLGLTPSQESLFDSKAAPEHRLGSRPGKEQLETLWHDAFKDVPVAAAPGAAVVDLVRLPTSISVRSTAHGLLEVTAKFSPKVHLPAPLREALNKESRSRLPAALQPHLQSGSHVQEVAWPELSEAVAKATEWLAVQEQNLPAAVEAVEKWLKEQKLAQVRRKLTEHFSAEERALLTTALAG